MDTSIEIPDDRDSGLLGGSAMGVVEALEEIVPGFELLDERLELETGARVDFVAREVGGDLLFVMPISGRGTSSLTAVLDLISYTRRNGSVLRRVYGETPHGVEPNLRLLVVAESYDDEVRLRLSALEACGVELLQFGALRSAAGERVFVSFLTASEPVRVERRAPVTPPDGVGAVLEPLPPRIADRVRSVMRRLERLDDSIDVRPQGEGLAWYHQHEVLARVEINDDGEAVGVVPGRGARPLTGQQGVELFLDEAVAAYVDRAPGRELETSDDV